MSRNNNTQEWHSLPNTRTNYLSEREVEIRVWEPGDGLHCRWASSNKTFTCGCPVAVLRTEETQTDYRTSRPVVRVRMSVLCSRHVAEAVRTFAGSESGKHHPTAITTESEKRARELVLTKHWDEYQRTVAGFMQVAQEEALAGLPKSLRSYFEAIETNA